MSKRPMHTSMRLIGLVFIASAAAVFSAAPAGALIASPESGSYVVIGNRHKAQFNTICGETFSYVQRMTIDGVSTMVPTSFIYPAGRRALSFLQTCDGYNFYGVGSCACRADVGLRGLARPPRSPG